MSNISDGESRWETLVALSADIFTVVDETGEIHYQSPAIEDILGYHQDELVGEDAFDYLHPDDREPILAEFEDILDAPGESTRRVEYRFRHADESWVWLETTASNRRGSDWNGYVLTSREITARKRRQAELEETRRRLSSVLNSIRLPVWMRNADHEYEVVNDEYRRLLDIDQEETLVGKTPGAIYDDETARSFESSDRHAFDAGERVEFEETVYIGDESLSYLTQITPLYDDDGGEYATVGIATEITELRNRERQLRERTKELEALHWTAETFAGSEQPLEELLASLVEELPGWFQYPEHTVARLRYGDVDITPDEFDPDTRRITATAETDEEATVTLDVGWADGGADDESKQFIDQERRLVDTLTTYLAETIGRRTQRRELQLFKRAVEAAGQAVFIADRDGVIEYVNPAFESHTGYSREETVGDTTRIHKSGRHEESFYESLWETVLSGENWEGELINERKDGSLYYADVTLSPISDDTGQITRFVAIESEITDRRMREQQLDVLNRILRHNLRNSLTVVAGHVALVEEELTDSDRLASIGVVNKHVENLERLSHKTGMIRTLLRRQPAPDCVCDVATMLGEIEHQFSKGYPHAEITVATAKPLAVHADGRLEVAIEEAVENAIVHNDRSTPSVRIEASVAPGASHDGVEIHICDDGPGIPDDQRSIIEAEGETSLEHASGIGLWIINWVLTMFGGDVTIEPRTPRGTSVILWLPAADP